MSRHDGGWLKLHRIPRDHWLWTDHSARFLWWNLLSMATWKQTKLPKANGFEVIKPGTIITSRSELASITVGSERVVRRCLERFIKDQMVAVKTSKAGSVIYLVNWDKYQNKEEEGANEGANDRSEKGPTEGQQRANRGPVSEECKNSKREPLGIKKICDDAPAIALPSGTKIFFEHKTEIPDSKTYLAGSMPSEARNTPSNLIPGTDTTTDIGDIKKSASVDVGTVKTDLPHDHGMNDPPKKKRVKKDETQEETAAALARSATWTAYSEAYEKRYGNRPIRAAKENTQIKNLVLSVGQQDAPFLVEFYLNCSDEFLVGRCHPIGVLASNPNEYVTRMKRGQTHRGTTKRSDTRRLPSYDVPNKYDFTWAEGCGPDDAPPAERGTDVE